MATNNFIPYGHQWIDNKDIEEVVKVLKGDWLTQGPKVNEFEKAIANYCGAKYAVAVSSGTAALHAAFSVAGIKSGDEVITTPLTFVATANAAVYCGAKPIFVDIEKETLNINPERIKEKITKKTKAIISVDFAGHPCDYNKIKKIAKKKGLLMIEDASQALGSFYQGKRIGALADMTIFSFHPVKAITTGEGGMILTNNKDFCRKLRIFRNHGMVKKSEKGAWYYEIKDLGYNYRLTDIQSALGVSQMKKLNKFLRRRKEIVARYNKAFKNIEEIVIPSEKRYAKSAWHIYIIQLALERLKANRRKVFEALRAENIGVQIHHIPACLQPFYKKKFGYQKGDFPIMERYYQRAITLPLFPKMTDKQVERVINKVKKVINLYKK